MAGYPFEELWEAYSEIGTDPDALHILYEKVKWSLKEARSGHERQRLEELRILVEQAIQKVIERNPGAVMVVSNKSLRLYKR